MESDTKTIELLEEILLWTKYDYKEIKEKLLKHLDTIDKKIAYELTNGKNSSRDIAAQIKTGKTTITQWWDKWSEIGIIEQTEEFGGRRYKKLISLTKMGIKLPTIEEDSETAHA